MIQSFIFSDGRLVGNNLEIGALRLVRADKGLVLWVDLHDPTDDEIKAVLENVFQFHPLEIEDCVAPSSLPTVEDYDDHLFIVAHGVDSTRTERFNTTEINIFLGKDFIVSFHRAASRSIKSAIERCTRPGGAGNARSPDRVAHLILDSLIDHFKPVTDELRTELDEIEAEVLEQDAGNELVSRLLEVRSEINLLRQIIRPLRDVVNRLAHGDNKHIRTIMLPYFRDLRDNLIRVDENAANYADQLLISFDLYLSKSDFQANEGIKALTALTALSLPATLIGTWYGMNFSSMPELHSPLGYPIAAIAAIASTAAIWFWCKRRRWI
ncbi:MAG: magnesium transporter CorA family protein [Opitutaceae bacterium]|jgi:magnesium transporter|nr:magnesium transporter CorA family protein [Opitutaceae bacterium]